MKKLFVILSIFVIGSAFSQADCNLATNVCNQNGFGFTTNTSGSGTVYELDGNNISNPSTNPGTAGNSGCLFSGELNPTWLIITAASNGYLEFTIGAGNGGYYDWAMWSYTNNGTTSSCDAITNNTLAPVACNWNASSQGFTGMVQPGHLPSGAVQGNFENSLYATAGQQFVICFSNFSGQVGVNVPVVFGAAIAGNSSSTNSATVTCTPTTPDQTICQGSSATVTIMHVGMTSPTFNWLVTTGVSNTTGGTNVTVTPTQTTEYHVAISENGVTVMDTFTIYVVNPPTPNAGIDDTICLGQPISLNGSISSTTNTFSWNYLTTGITPTPTVTFSPNFSTLNPTVTVNQLGLYKFILRETNTTCGVVRDTVKILVSQITQTTSGVDPTCYNASDGELHINSPLADEFSFDNGTTWQTDSVSYGYSAGTYTVCSRNNMGCQVCNTVTLNNPPEVTIMSEFDTTICQNGTASLYANSTNGTSFQYHWSHTTSTVANQLVNPVVSTVYYVYGENEKGCISQTDSVSVILYDPISGTISPVDSVCPGYPATLTATATGGIGQPYSFSWSSGDNGTGLQDEITKSPTEATTYTLTVTDACESTPLILNTGIEILPLPVPLISVDDPNKCEPAQFVLTNETDPTMVDHVYWELSNGQMFLDEQQITTASMVSGLYNVQLIVTSPQGCIDSTTFVNYLNVYPKPEADFKYIPNPVTMFNTSVSFQNYTTNADSYAWYFESGSPSYSYTENPIVLFPDGQVGEYLVTLIATSDFGCIDTNVQKLIVQPEILLFAPNTFTPDDDEFNQSWGVEIQGIDKYNFDLFVYNRWGQIVWESHDPEVKWDGTFDGKYVPQGVYNWKIRAKDILTDAYYTYQGFVTILR